MQLYESRLRYFNDKARINYRKRPSVHQHGGPSRPRQNCHSCIFETKENSNLRICIQYLGNHSETTCQKSAISTRYRVRPKFEFYGKPLLSWPRQPSQSLGLSLSHPYHSHCPPYLTREFEGKEIFSRQNAVMQTSGMYRVAKLLSFPVPVYFYFRFLSN